MVKKKKERNAHILSPKDMHDNVHSSSIHNSSKLETLNAYQQSDGYINRGIFTQFDLIQQGEWIIYNYSQHGWISQTED